MIYVDITNVLKTAFSIPTGIPRVEHAMARHFLSRPDDARAIYFSSGDWFIVSAQRVSGLLSLLDGEGTSIDGAGYWKRLRWGFATIGRALRPLDKELHRAVASRVSGGRRGGTAYALHKLLFRAAGLGATLSASPRSGRLSKRLAEDDRLVVSLVTAMAAPEQVLAARYARQAFVIVYDTTPLDYPDMTTRKIAARFPGAFRLTMERARGILCISQFTRDQALAWASRLGVANPPAADVFRMSSPLIEKALPTQPLPDGLRRPFVLFCATIEPRKNHLALLRVWRRLLDALPGEPPLLVLVGKIGWKAEAILAFLESDAMLRQHVMLIGDGDDALLASLYRHARFTVFPSIAEGWGLGASESLDFGTPVVVSTCGALIEATDGLMPAIAAEDEEGWYDTLLRLLTDDAALEALRARIRDRYRHQPSEEGMRDVRRILARPVLPGEDA